MSDVKASLIIPSYKGAKRLPVLLEALRHQDAEFAWEALVVIDGVTDNSEAIIASYSDIPVRAIVLPENRGRSAALNAGFQAATGDVLIRCDDDLEPKPDYVRLHVAAHDGPEHVGVVGLYRNQLPDTLYAEAYGRHADIQFRHDAYGTPEKDWWKYWAGNCSVTREDFDRVGDYDTSFREYGWEDVDWGYRLSLAGLQVKLHQELETTHHVAATTTEIRVLRALWSGRAKARFDAKHGVLPIPVDDNANYRQRVWRSLIFHAGKYWSEASLTSTAKVVDRTVPFMPQQISKKMVAFLIESAATQSNRT